MIKAVGDKVVEVRAPGQRHLVVCDIFHSKSVRIIMVDLVYTRKGADCTVELEDPVHLRGVLPGIVETVALPASA